MHKSKAKLIVLFFLVLIYQNTYAQLSDLARFEYSYIPKGNSEDNFSRFRGLVNYPIKTKEDCYLLVGCLLYTSDAADE